MNTSLGALALGLLWSHRCTSTTLVLFRVGVQFVSSEESYIVRVADAALCRMFMASFVRTRDAWQAMMDAIMSAVRDALKIVEVVISRVSIFVVDMESARYWSVGLCPNVPVPVLVFTINHQSLVSI